MLATPKCFAVVEEYSNVLSSRHYSVRMVDSVHGVIGVPEQRVGETGLKEIHREEGGDSDDLVKEDVDTLPVPDILPCALLTQPGKFVLFYLCSIVVLVYFLPQQAGGGQGQKLLQSVLDIIVTSEAEQAAKQLVNGRGQAVDIVTVTLQLGLEQRLGFMLCLYLLHLVFGAF